MDTLTVSKTGQKGHSKSQSATRKRIRVEQFVGFQDGQPPKSANSEWNKITCTVQFIDEESQQKGSIQWPVLKRRPAPNKFEPSTKLAELARNLINYLNELEFTTSTLNKKDSKLEWFHKEPETKSYNCDLNVFFCQDKFEIRLILQYHTRKQNYHLHPSLYISNQQLLYHLVNKIVLKVTPSQAQQEFEKKLKLLLCLVSLKCYINDLEIEI
ncbi:uncharacterized protein RJT20DRAFT_128345 [Scheffersomyces xylosifermentans]|uniref:uncharacterized protein n=1 Tax=Scheffersomyces xylosifermentans TaxID=1304137 RepID=UPI00315D297D